MIFLFVTLILVNARTTIGFWDFASTTTGIERTDTYQRTSFFRWQRIEFDSMQFWFPNFDWTDISYRRRLCYVAGISIDFLPLSTATLLNRRILLTSANYLDPWMDRQLDLRIWALGRAGQYNTPYRYRVFKVWRLFPRSLNPEHQHGSRSGHCPRHDVAVIISYDQIYLYYKPSSRYMYAHRAYLIDAHSVLSDDLWFAGSGYEYLQHIYENYKIFYSHAKRTQVVDCSIYLPKWWGKFICLKNVYNFSGLQNGGGLYAFGSYIVGIGCFEIRYNEDRILVFTDLRYYVNSIYKYANITPGQYYEYAYPHWSIILGTFFDGGSNYPYIPGWQIQYDLYPLG